MKRTAAAEHSWEKAEKFQLSHEGTGTPDTTKHEFLENRAKDTLYTIAFLPGLLTYQSMALGKPEFIVRSELLSKMAQPCGPPPPTPFEEMKKRAIEKLNK